MDTRLHLEMLPQPDSTTCGPTCLHAIYRYHGASVELAELVAEVPQLPTGGTLAVLMANHALSRGYGATIVTWDLQLFDPTWFAEGVPIRGIADKLVAQAEVKADVKLRAATQAYLSFLRHGGILRLGEPTPTLIRGHLNRNRPVLAGLSATYLYQCAREMGPSGEYDDIRGEPSGHFVVLCGYDKIRRLVLVADPLFPNPVADQHYYSIPLSRVSAAILLGILTYDANLLVIEPAPGP